MFQTTNKFPAKKTNLFQVTRWIKQINQCTLLCDSTKICDSISLCLAKKHDVTRRLSTVYTVQTIIHHSTTTTSRYQKNNKWTQWAAVCSTSVMHSGKCQISKVCVTDRLLV